MLQVKWVILGISLFNEWNVSTVKIIFVPTFHTVFLLKILNHINLNSKGYFVLKIQIKMLGLKISGIQNLIRLRFFKINSINMH